MSRGYTKALARMAPLAPAIANPQGGIASFELTLIVTVFSFAMPRTKSQVVVLPAARRTDMRSVKR